MNKTLKHLYLGILFIGFLTIWVSCSDSKEDEIEHTVSLENLPLAAQTFLSTYFPEVTVKYIYEETAGDITVYEVELENGFEVVFNYDGEWQQIEAPYYMTVPTSVIPEQVMNTLNERYSSYAIIEINTTSEGWKVELSSSLSHQPGEPGLDLWFNMSGEIISTSQDNV